MYYRADGRTVALGAEIGAGGEARIFGLAAEPRLVAKVYHQPSRLRAAKLRAMLASPPRDPADGSGHVSIVWPRELIFDSTGLPIGFLMPRIDFSRAIPLLHLYNPADRVQRAPGFTWRYLLRALRNLASVVDALHARGYVVGDLNESNVLVSDSALVTMVDCDSIQVPAPGGGFFRCTVGKAEYTPPELQGCQFGAVDRNVAHDDFGLAVLGFMLLMEGFHPFAGVWHDVGDPPTLEERIRRGAWPYQPNRLTTPPPYAPSFDLLPGEVRQLFLRAFRDGYQHPVARPDPATWKHVCELTERRLKECRLNRQHVFSQHVRACPWCERVRLGFPDPFPPLAVAQPAPAAPTPVRARRADRTTPRPPRPAPPTPLPVIRTTSGTATSAASWYLRSSSWVAYLVGALIAAWLPIDQTFMQSIVAGVVSYADRLVVVAPLLFAALATLAGVAGRSPGTLRGAVTAYLAAVGVLFIAVAFSAQSLSDPSGASFLSAVETIDGAGAALLTLLAARLLHRRVAAHLARAGPGFAPAVRVIGGLGGGGAALAIMGLAALAASLGLPTAVAGASAQRPVPAIGTVAASPTVPMMTQLVVANTGGQGVYLHHTPRLADRWVAWPDGTRLEVVGPDADGDGYQWKQVRDPAGHVGWVPAEYVAPAL